MSFILLGILNSQAAAAVVSGVAGYAAGGESGSEVSTVDKFAFPSDSRSTLATGLSSSRKESTGFSDSLIAGYVAGGFGISTVSTVDKFAFPSDSRSTLGTGLSAPRERTGSFQDA